MSIVYLKNSERKAREERIPYRKPIISLIKKFISEVDRFKLSKRGNPLCKKK